MQTLTTPSSASEVGGSRPFPPELIDSVLCNVVGDYINELLNPETINVQIYEHESVVCVPFDHLANTVLSLRCPLGCGTG